MFNLHLSFYEDKNDPTSIKEDQTELLPPLISCQRLPHKMFQPSSLLLLLFNYKSRQKILQIIRRQVPGVRNCLVSLGR
jgi:hypothetical protein